MVHRQLRSTLTRMLVYFHRSFTTMPSCHVLPAPSLNAWTKFFFYPPIATHNDSLFDPSTNHLRRVRELCMGDRGWGIVCVRHCGDGSAKTNTLLLILDVAGWCPGRRGSITMMSTVNLNRVLSITL